MVAIIGRKLPTTGGAGGQSGGLGNVFDQLAATLADPLTPELKRQKIRELTRQNVETEAFSRGLAAGDADTATQMARAAAAGLTPEHARSYFVSPTLLAPGADINSPEYTQALVAGGTNYKATPRATYDEPMNVVGPTGLAEIKRRGEAYGAQPVLPLQETKGLAATNAQAQPGGLAALDRATQAFIGAQPTADDVFNIGLPNGGSQAMRLGPSGEPTPITYQGQPVPSIGKIVGTTSDAFGKGDPNEKSVIDQRVATQQLLNSVQQLDTMLKQPGADQSVGWLGRGAQVLNDIAVQTSAAARAAGFVGLPPELQAKADAAMSDPRIQAMLPELQKLGVNSTVIRSQIINLAYLLAKTQNAGSSQISAEDFDNALQTVGGSLHDPLAMRHVLATVAEGAVNLNRTREQVLQDVRGKAIPGTAPTYARPADLLPLGGGVQAPQQAPMLTFNPLTGRFE